MRRRTDPENTDAFGLPFEVPRSNVIDIASHYPYSPERWRVFVDGSRVFPEYGSVSQYNHATAFHELIPAQGETVALQTAERPRYVVGYEYLATLAAATGRALESGDVVRFGHFDGAEGWYVEYNAADDAEEVRLVAKEAGSVIETNTVRTARGIDTFARHELAASWYRIGPQVWHKNFAAWEFVRERLGQTGLPDGDGSGAASFRGPEVGNLPLRFEVTRGASSSALTLRAGSVSMYNIGETTPFVRVKTHDVIITSGGTADEWFPVYAMRVDPAQTITNTQIDRLAILNVSSDTASVEMTLRAMDPANVVDGGGSPLSDGDFSTPTEHSTSGSVLEHTDPQNNPIAEAVDSTGTLVTSTADRAGGYQVGHASQFTSGQGNKQQRGSAATNQKRDIKDTDLAVAWVRSDETNVDITLEITTEQDW